MLINSMFKSNNRLSTNLHFGVSLCNIKDSHLKQRRRGTSLVQCLRRHASDAGGVGLILGQGTKIPQAPRHGLKKKKKKKRNGKGFPWWSTD